MNVDLLTAAMAGLGGSAVGYVVALVVVARDKSVVKVPEDCLLVKRDILAKLQEIAEVKMKNPRLKFDSRGMVHGVKQDDDDEEP